MSLILEKKRIMAVGMCCLDVVHISEKQPEENQQTNVTSSYWQRGGKASNMVTVLRHFDVDCEFFGMVSNRHKFTFLLDDCTKRGIFTENCPTVSQDPPMTTVINVKSLKTITIIHANDRFPGYTYEHFMRIPNLGIYGWIHFESRQPDATLRMLQHLNAWNRTYDEKINASLCLNTENKEFLQLAPWANVVFITKQYAEYMGWTNMKKAVYKLCDIMKKPYADFNRPVVICYWGPMEGACYMSATDQFGEVISKITSKSDLTDTYGADDTFCASVIYSLYSKLNDLPTAIGFGILISDYKAKNQGFSVIRSFRKSGYKY